jgi:nucleoid DNA-binding protein
MDKPALVTALALNYPITGQQAEDILEVLGAITQFALQQGGSVLLPGIGTLTVNERSEVVFTPADKLKAIVADAQAQVRIENVKGITSSELYMGDATIYKHKVNVC